MRLVLALLLTVGVAAQEPAQQPIFRAGTDLVRVDVTVTARNEPVADLTLEDFELTEDGVAQTVETIKFIKVDGTRTSNLDEPLEIRSKEHAMLEVAREDVR
ncbi:MAG: hypothetical protein ACKOEC_07930, partial [Acidimicrobiia bacterium]